jgi:fatty-acyl-CoA synthase
MEIQVIDIHDSASGAEETAGTVDYEALLASAADVDLRYPQDEWDAIALNYTSGPTGSPKGVVYHHRGAYLNALGQSINAGLAGADPVYLWTLPLFHCNGWCFAWAMAAMGGTHICLRKVVAKDIYDAIATHGVTHLCCAPTVLDLLIDGKPVGAHRHRILGRTVCWPSRPNCSETPQARRCNTRSGRWQAHGNRYSQRSPRWVLPRCSTTSGPRCVPSSLKPGSKGPTMAMR